MFVSNPLFRERQRHCEWMGSLWRDISAGDGHNFTVESRNKGKDVLDLMV